MEDQTPFFNNFVFGAVRAEGLFNAETVQKVEETVQALLDKSPDGKIAQRNIEWDTLQTVNSHTVKIVGNNLCAAVNLISFENKPDLKFGHAEELKQVNENIRAAGINLVRVALMVVGTKNYGETFTDQAEVTATLKSLQQRLKPPVRSKKPERSNRGAGTPTLR